MNNDKIESNISSFLERIIAIKEKIQKKDNKKKMKAIIIGIALFYFIIAIGLTVVESFFIDWDTRGKSVVDGIAKQIGAQIFIKGHSRGRVFPSSITINNLVVVHKSDDKSDVVDNVSEIYVKISFWSVVFNKVSISKFIVKDSLFSASVLKDMSASDNSVEVVMSNCSIRAWDSNSAIMLTRVNGSLIVGRYSTNANLSFVLNNETYKAKVVSSEKGKGANAIKGILDSTNFVMSFDGYGYFNEGSYKLDGSINGHGENFMALLDKITSTENKNILGGYSINERYILSGNVKVDKDIFMLSDFKIESQGINGTMDLSYQFSGVKHSEFNLHINNINLDLMKSNNSKENKNNIIKTMDFRLPKISGFFVVDVDNVQHNSMIFKNIHLEGDIISGDVSLYEMRAIMPGDSVVNIIGDLKDNGIRLMFNGSIAIGGRNLKDFFGVLPISKVGELPDVSGEFYIKSDIILTPHIIYFFNLNLESRLNKINGSFRYKWGSTKKIITASLEIDHIDISAFKNSLRKASSTGDFYGILSPKLRAKLDLKIRNLIFDKNENVVNPSFSIEIYNNSITVKKFKISSNSFDVMGDIRIVYGDSAPIIYAKIKSKYIKINSFDEYLFDQKKYESVFEWSDKNINLSFLNDIKATIEFELDKFICGNFIAEKVLLVMNLEDNNLKIENASMIFADGKSSFSIYAGLRKKNQINLVFSLSDVNLEKFANIAKLESIGYGYMSVSGSVASFGNNVKEIFSGLNGAINVAVRDAVINGVDFDGLADNIISVDNKSDMIAVAEKSIYSGSTMFKSIDMSIKVESGIGLINLTNVTSRTASVAAINIGMVNLLINGIMRIYFIPPKANDKVAIDLDLKGFVKYPVRSFDENKLSDLVFKGISADGTSVKNK